MTHEIIGDPIVLADGRSLPLSKAIRAGEFLFLSGQLGINAAGQLVGEDVASQTHQCIANIEDVLKSAGARLSHVIRATVWLTTPEDFAAFNEAYASHFPARFPVRSTLCSALVLPGARVEIEVLAYAPQ